MPSRAAQSLARGESLASQLVRKNDRRRTSRSVTTSIFRVTWGTKDVFAHCETVKRGLSE